MPDLDPAAPSAAGGPACGGFYTGRDARRRLRFELWMLVASLAYIGATAALRWQRTLPASVVWLALGLAVVLAILAARSFLKFLRGADELLRRIQTEALALGFAAGAGFSLLYPLLEQLGAPNLDFYGTPVVMMLSWSLGAWIGKRRYAGTTP